MTFRRNVLSVCVNFELVPQTFFFFRLSYLTEEDDHKLILKPCVPVTHLFLGESTPSSIVDNIAYFCPGLKEIVIAAYGPEAIDKSLVLIAKSCTRLAAVGIGDCEIRYDNILFSFINTFSIGNNF